MTRILIFGNSGSGKSTLAKTLAGEHGLAHLDLDTLAWLPTSPPQRMPLAESRAAIDAFMAAGDRWVIEGCYADLLAFAAAQAEQAIFMNLPVAACIENARQRPWEPHKYASSAEQDANLDMLIDWIAQYPTRDDVFSEAAHKALYAGFRGDKLMYTSNQRN
ncbi:MAG: AAA family ATPase [Halioglobus sp.]|nr:AAA family ATPase [Halioglobus sp.]